MARSHFQLRASQTETVFLRCAGNRTYCARRDASKRRDQLLLMLSGAGKRRAGCSALPARRTQASESTDDILPVAVPGVQNPEILGELQYSTSIQPRSTASMGKFAVPGSSIKYLEYLLWEILLLLLSGTVSICEAFIDTLGRGRSYQVRMWCAVWRKQHSPSRLRPHSSSTYDEANNCFRAGVHWVAGFDVIV